MLDLSGVKPTLFWRRRLDESLDTIFRLMRPIPSFSGSNKLCFFIIGAIFSISRLIYHWLGIRFDAGSLDSWQFIDPALLRDAPWQSLFYSRAQLPGMNLWLAVITHLFPRHVAEAFDAMYLVLGFVLGVCLFLLLERLHLSRALGLLVVVICIASPVTVLFENWLFYEYPLAVLFCLCALFLHRYASSHHALDAALFFVCLAFISLFRVIFHFLWFVLIAVVLAYAIPKQRRKTALSAAGPGFALLLVYFKSLVLFGLAVPGSDTHGAINFAFLTSLAVPRTELVRMVAEKQISPILLHGFRFEDEQLVSFIPLPAKTGIAILDERLKSNGSINMDSLWMAAVGRQLRKDGLVILKTHPEATLKDLRQNIINYFLPANINWPFGSKSEHLNQLTLAPELAIVDLVTTGKPARHNYAPISYAGIVCLLGFGLWRSMHWLRRMIRHAGANACDLTTAFAFGNIAYLSVVVVFYDCTDQNRVLFEVFPLFMVLLASLIVVILKRRVLLNRARAFAFATANSVSTPNETSARNA